MTLEDIEVVAEPETRPRTAPAGRWGRLRVRAAELWWRARNAVTLGLFGVSGSAAVGSVQHVIQTCRGGNCSGCGSCVAALAAAVASASAGVAGRTAGRRRRLLIACVIVVGLALYGVLEAWKRGLIPVPG